MKLLIVDTVEGTVRTLDLIREINAIGGEQLTPIIALCQAEAETRFDEADICLINIDGFGRYMAHEALFEHFKPVIAISEAPEPCWGLITSPLLRFYCRNSGISKFMTMVKDFAPCDDIQVLVA